MHFHKYISMEEGLRLILLLSNDDGIFAEGIQVLADTLSRDEDVTLYIVAPDHEQSAAGHAITMHRPLRVKSVKYRHNADLTCWSVNGTPADCVKLAVESLLPEKPDLIVSGINNGSNLGGDIFYSGTVAAALEGAILGIPAVAVSLTDHKNPDYGFAAEFTFRLLKTCREKNLPRGAVLNVNIPAKKKSEIAGVAVTRLGTRQYRNAFDRRIDPKGREYYWMAGEVQDVFEDEKDTDVAAIYNSYISITPLHFDLTDFGLLEVLRGSGWGFPDLL